ncbi:MAG: hypothetical protein FJ037_06515 [Chloroflexi bacterium]|nr:hypothetical protein [Chloroflexota bacterium]
MNERALFTADRWFRILGAGTVMALISTGILLFAEGNAWRVMFVITHLAALLALLPLGVVLVLRAYRHDGGLVAMTARHPLVGALLACLAVTVTMSLLNFQGDREIRRIANLTTVAIVLALVVRYLMWSKEART